MLLKATYCGIVLLTLAVSGCSAPKKQSDNKTTSSGYVSEEVVSSSDDKKFQPFYVYQDKHSRNRFTPSGYMPNGECLDLDDGWQYDPKEGKTSTRIVFDVVCSRESRKWAGIYWQNPPDNWGYRKGGYDLTGASKLVFWAKGELGGERIEEFRVGGIGQGQDYPDSDSASIGPVILTKEWKLYTIDLRGRDLSYISGGFAWSASVQFNPHHCTFYLDDIHFE